MNISDSEIVGSILKDHAFSTCTSHLEADIILINTCSVRDHAEQRVYKRLREFRSLKKKNKNLLIGILGCMAERLKEELLKEELLVDLVLGPDSYRDLPYLIKSAQQGEKAINVFLSTDETYAEIHPERIQSNGVSAFISIMRGCENFCSYCVVPFTRGKERSRDPHSIAKEANELFKKGFREVTLLGQNVNSYHWTGDSSTTTFSSLIKKIAEINPLLRVRFATSHPKDLSDDLIMAIKECDKVCKHMHLPLQSGSSRVLKEMNRHYDKEKYLDEVKRLREQIPDIAITTDIIVGFPGETEEDFLETMDVVKQVRYDSAFTFIYSKRTGTRAATMENQVPDDVVKDRFDRLLKEVQTISSEKAKCYEGKVVPVLAEEMDDQKDGYVTGRMDNNSIVHFPGTEDMIGNIYNVKLDECRGFYYMGEIKEDA